MIRTALGCLREESGALYAGIQWIHNYQWVIKAIVVLKAHFFRTEDVPLFIIYFTYTATPPHIAPCTINLGTWTINNGCERSHGGWSLPGRCDTLFRNPAFILTCKAITWHDVLSLSQRFHVSNEHADFEAKSYQVSIVRCPYSVGDERHKYIYLTDSCANVTRPIFMSRVQYAKIEVFTCTDEHKKGEPRKEQVTVESTYGVGFRSGRSGRAVAMRKIWRRMRMTRLWPVALWSDNHRWHMRIFNCCPNPLMSSLY